MIYKRNEKQKKEEEQLNYPKEKKSTLKTLLPTLFWKYWAIYRQKGAPGRVYGAARQSTTRGSKLWPQKCSHVHGSLAIKASHARRRLPRAVSSSLYLLYLLVS